MAELSAPQKTGSKLHYPELKTLVDTAHFHATHQPLATAVLCEGRSLTYAGAAPGE